MNNPFFDPAPTTGIPPFDQIEFRHYREAFDYGFAEHNAEVNKIITTTESPTFENTVEALERSGAQLERVAKVFFIFTSANTTEEIQTLEMEVASEFAVHHGKIWSDPELFVRVKAVVEGNENFEGEQLQLMNETYKAFVRAGAELNEKDRDRVNAINEKLAGLTTEFGQNVLKDTNGFELVLDEGDDLSGLPDFVLNMGKAEAELRDKPGKYVFTISRSSITPILQYADKRERREQIYKAYTACGTSRSDNHVIIQSVVSLRDQRSKLLGFQSHADFMLDNRMAKTPEAVSELLDQVWAPCQNRVAEEAKDLQARIQEGGGNFELAPWDWWYYTEKIRQERFDLDDDEVKPYFQLNRVRDGAFEVAGKLYGLVFKPRPDLPVYHPDVVAYEVTEADGSLIGYFFLIFSCARPSEVGHG